MGKLHLDQDDLTRLADVLKKPVSITDDTLQVDLGGPTLSLSAMTTEGHFDQNGVRFEISARFKGGCLDVEFH